MRKKLAIYLMIFIIFQIVKALLILDYKGEYGDSRIETAINKKYQVTYDYMLLTEGYSKLQPIMLSKSEDLEVKGCQSATVIGITSNWVQLEKFRMIDGAFFGEEANKEERDLTVISSQLSIKLFGSGKAVGNTLSIENKYYQIVGVYKKHTRLRDYVLDDGSESIYIPIKSSVARSWNVQSIIIDGKCKEEVPQVNDLQKLEVNKENSHISDQSKWVKNMQSLSQLPLVIFWLILCSGILKTTTRMLSDKMQTKWLKFAKGVSYLIILYIAFKICFYKVYIDPTKLPAENIFDICFYLEALKTEWIRHSQFVGNKVSHFERALYSLKLILYSINSVQIIIGVKIGLLGMKNNIW
jgi:hypothetical protein